MTKDLSWLRTLPGKPLIVAEIKQRSPFGWVNPMHWRDQLAVCESVGDIISVHTNPLWGGSWDQLDVIRQRTSKPILAKGFHDTVHDVQRALDCGAEHVLTVGWHPDLLSHPGLYYRCWHEVGSLVELSETLATRAVWNARCPRTGMPRRGDRGSVAWANGQRPYSQWLCQASHIRGPEDVMAGMDAILIGEGLYQ